MRKVCLLNIFATLALALLNVRAPAQAQETVNQEFVIRDARIFDGSHVIPQGDVWVQNGAIKAVGPHLNVPSGVRSIDGTGKTLLAGLIDAHVHTMAMDNFLRSARALGVTTELDMGAAPRYAVKIETEQAGQREPLGQFTANV
jgi:cytosine/adenosine deaminase-related metal-dependent hydrolase